MSNILEWQGTNMEAKLRELERKAAMALALAQEVKASQTKHEVECAARYTDLQATLIALPEMKATIDAIMRFVNDMRTVVRFFKGCGSVFWKAGRAITLLAAVVFAVYKLSVLFHGG